MALTVDKVSISNEALMLIGASRIYEPDENSEPARVCDVFFDTTLDEVLAANNWNCARDRKTLPLTPPHPDFGWTYRFSLPANPYCLFVVREYNDEPFVVEGRYLLANVPTVEVMFLKRITVMGELSAKLREAFVFKLAAKLAIPLQGDLDLKKDMASNFNTAIITAGGRASQEGDEQRPQNSGSWNQSRFNRTGYRDY